MSQLVWKKIRGSEILGLSLTELLMLITFALLLVMAIFFRDLQAALSVSEGIEPIMRAATEHAKKSREVMEIYFGIKTPPLSSPSPADQFALSDTALSALISEAEKPEAQKHLRQHKLPEIWSELTNARRSAEEAKTQAQELQEKLDQFEQELAGLAKNIPELEKRNRNLEGMVKNLKNRGTGRDHPPCWTTPQGEIEFTYEVRVGESEFTIRPILPEYRIADLIQVSNDSTLRQSRQMARPEFRKKMRPFFDYGSSANPQCRFWVKVVDDTGPASKDAWKSGLAIVERFFYKELRK